MSERKFLSAVALEYDEESALEPFISARGEAELADLIVQIARKNGVPVIEKRPLARSLLVLDEGDSIPLELFKAVAVLFREVEKLLKPRYT